MRRIFEDRAFSSSQVVAALTSPPMLPRDFEDKVFRALQKLAKDVDESAIHSFIESNRAQVGVESVYGEVKYALVASDETLRSALDTGERGWSAFYQRYPESKGIVYLSSPRFSADGTQCVVEVGQQQGDLWGHGIAYLYRESGAGWSKNGEIRTWVS